MTKEREREALDGCMLADGIVGVVAPHAIDAEGPVIDQLA